MTAPIALLLAITGLLFCINLSLRRQGLSMRRQYAAALAGCAAARESEASVTRALQLCALDLQGLGLTLRGHADRLAAEQHQHAPSLATAAAQLGGLADELCHHLLPTDQPHALECEWVDLPALVQDAVADLSAAIRPGRRIWRVQQGGSPSEAPLWADRRALRLLLIRVLGEAARSSAHDDFIDVFWTHKAGGVAIHIEDEGSGSARPSAAAAGVLDTRGIGLRLSLARSLTQAHGGTLQVEAQAHIGTSVTITLPKRGTADQMAMTTG